MSTPLRTAVRLGLALALAFGLAAASVAQTPAGGAAQKPAAASTPAAAKAPAAPTAAAPPAAAAKPAAVPEFDPKSLPAVVATLDGAEISREQLLVEAEKVQRGMAHTGAATPLKGKDLYRGILEQLLAKRLMLAEAKSLNLVPSDADVEKEVASMKEHVADPKKWEEMLKSQATTEAEVRSDIKENKAIQAVIKSKIEPTVIVSEPEQRKFYDENKDKMTEPERYRASHILIKVAQGATAEEKAKARQKAEGLLAQIKGGADFGKLANESSDDPGSKSNGGELPWLGKGQTVPAFEQAMLALKPGELSGVVETNFGFHLIKLLEIKAARVVPFEEVKARIAQYLQNLGLKGAIDKHINELKAKAKVEVKI